MKISVVVTTYNEEKNIIRLLQALENQSIKPSEILIVDNKSSDNTLKLISDFKAKSSLNIRVLSKKCSRPRGRNLGIGEGVGEVIAVTDSGCLPSKNWLKNITRPITNQKVDVVGGIYNFKTPTIFTQCSAAYFGPMSHNINTSTFIPASRSLAFTKRAWHLVNGYPIHSSTACEDLLFAAELFKHPELKSIVKKSASVEWTPASNIKQFYKDIKNHTIGNIEAGYTPHLSKNYLVLMRYVVAWPLIAILLIIPSAASKLILTLLIILYLLYPSFKFISQVKSPLHIIYFSFLQIVSDMAVLSALFTLPNKQFKSSYNNKILIDSKNKIVHRLSKNKIGNLNLQTNYKFLINNKRLNLNIAKPLGQISINNLLITDESLLPGKALKVNQVNSKTLLKALSHLKPLYLTKKSKTTLNISKELNSYDIYFKYFSKNTIKRLKSTKAHILKLLKGKGGEVIKTQIHGDLTFDNILRFENKFYYVDFDRSCFSFAEFDAYLFMVYWQTKKSPNPNYQVLFDNILKINQINDFYKMFPEFNINKKNFQTIKLIFLYRMLVLTQQNFL